MEITLRLALPRDQLSIPVVRRVLDRAMEVLGVEPADRSDIQVAITEACTNVLEHAAEGEDYEVTCGIDDRGCQIRIFDRGVGFDGAAETAAAAAAGDLPLAAAAGAEPGAEPDGETSPEGTPERGRGVLLMRALVDRVRFERREEEGTVVSLEKRLRYVVGSPADRLSDS